MAQVYRTELTPFYELACDHSIIDIVCVRYIWTRCELVVDVEVRAACCEHRDTLWNDLMALNVCKRLHRAGTCVLAPCETIENSLNTRKREVLATKNTKDTKGLQ